ncbi:O-antigen ligase family protein [Globicatella sanguinis]|uniref:O-antigen ligase family protein n=1 Tax=Globicatella sanguinis TaxID=13076 RepID=UPI000825B0DE|nr:O-antigen ligase family protein [Globicatella sanguinis]
MSLKRFSESILYFLFFVSFFEPNIINILPNLAFLGTIFVLLRILITIIYIPKSLIYTKINIMDLLIFCFLFSQVLASIVNKTFYFTYGLSILNYFGAYCFLKLNFQRGNIKLIKEILMYLSIFMIVQVLTQIIFKSGFDSTNIIGDSREYFLGRKNAMTPYLLLYMTLLSYYYELHDIHKFNFRQVILILFLAIFSQSATTLLTSISFLFLLTFRKVLIEKYDLKRVLLILYFLVTFLFSTGSTNNVVFKIISGIFNRDVTFSGRLQIWDLAILYFKKNFIWGAGLDLTFVPWTNSLVVNTAHNYLFDLAARFGIITIIFFIIIVLKNFNSKDNLLIISFFSYLMYTLVEFSPTIFFIFFNGIIWGNYFKNKHSVGEESA